MNSFPLATLKTLGEARVPFRIILDEGLLIEDLVLPPQDASMKVGPTLPVLVKTGECFVRVT